MHKNIILIFSSIFLFSCNKHSNVIQLKPKDNNNFVYQEKPFELKWKIEKNSITNIPLEVHKKIKNICKNYDRFVLTKIKTFKDDTVQGTFDCRVN